MSGGTGLRASSFSSFPINPRVERGRQATQGKKGREGAASRRGNKEGSRETQKRVSKNPDVRKKEASGDRSVEPSLPSLLGPLKTSRESGPRPARWEQSRLRTRSALPLAHPRRREAPPGTLSLAQRGRPIKQRPPSEEAGTCSHLNWLLEIIRCVLPLLICCLEHRR